MKVKMPMFSVEARGTVGGLTYNTWRGINYVKTATSPTGQGTAARLVAQGILITAAKLWATIGDVKRAAWNQYATDHPVTNWTGTPERLTGMNWFIRCWIAGYRCVGSGPTSAPASAAPNPITGLALTKPADYLQLAWTTPTVAPDRVDIWMVGPISAGIAPKIQRAKFSMIALAESLAGVILVNAPANGRWTVFARTINYTTGLSSSWLSDYVDVS